MNAELRAALSAAIEKPVITAVNGAAYAGGFRLAQFGDICLAAESASFAISEAKWSRGAPWAAPLTRMLPGRVLAELLLTAQPISARRAYEVGLVNEIVPQDELLPRAWAIAETIAANAPLSIRASKWLMRVGAEAGVAATGAIAGEIFRHVYDSEDAREGHGRFVRGADRNGGVDEDDRAHRGRTRVLGGRHHGTRQAGPGGARRLPRDGLPGRGHDVGSAQADAA
ncbi:enoyl-CoA hydratase/isomerase family protein [Spirillospora sp. CA-255316]